MESAKGSSDKRTARETKGETLLPIERLPMGGWGGGGAFCTITEETQDGCGSPVPYTQPLSCLLLWCKVSIKMFKFNNMPML